MSIIISLFELAVWPLGPMSIEAVRLRGRLVQQRAMRLGTMEMEHMENHGKLK